MLKELYDNNFISHFIREKSVLVIPYLRRFLRLLALPYCYFVLINWDICNASRYKVFKDILFIFFRLKYFPDNYSLCRLWEKDKKEWYFYYGSIYDPYQKGQLSREVQRPEYSIIFKDKELCYRLCEAAGISVPKQYDCIDVNGDYNSTIQSILKNSRKKKLIIKPTRGKGGTGIFLAVKEGDKILIKYNTKGQIAKQVPIEDFILENRSVIQEFLDQHEQLNLICPSSVNTVRIVTLLTKDGNILIVGAQMRFGVSDAFVDNTSSGGIGIGIDIDKGILKKTAYDLESRTYLAHPVSGVVFLGYQIPYWEEVVALSKTVQSNFAYHKLLGLDIAISPNGPVLIEINDDYDNVGLEQKYGPILSNKKIFEEFKKYNLLINSFQRKLYV